MKKTAAQKSPVNKNNVKKKNAKKIATKKSIKKKSPVKKSTVKKSTVKKSTVNKSTKKKATQEQTWYHLGLQFGCTGCGDCCTGAPGYVWINKKEIEAMADKLGMSVERFERNYVRLVGIRKSLIEMKGGDCVFFDAITKGCKIYEVRPAQCGTWPFWDSNLSSRKNWADISEHCPGCNRGDFFTFEEIEERRKTTKL